MLSVLNYLTLLLCIIFTSIDAFHSPVGPWTSLPTPFRAGKVQMLLPDIDIHTVEAINSISRISHEWKASVETTIYVAKSVSEVDINGIITQAIEKGKSGASAASVQVLTLMWLRTTLNYQYRYGTNTSTALKTLWDEGGITRLYQGLPFALVQGPLARFGDTAANAVVLAYLDAMDPTGGIPLFARTAAGSVSAGLWRLVILPIDTFKTTLQVNGEAGLDSLKGRVKTQGLSVLYSGAVASVLSTIVGHYPWFFVYNALSDAIPTAQDVHAAAPTSAITDLSGHPVMMVMASLDSRLYTLLRSALIGVCASSASDVCSNSLRVLKTVRQTEGSDTDSGSGGGDGTSSSNSGKEIIEYSYLDTARSIVRQDGLAGLFGRGLGTRLAANALQGALFSVLFKFFQGKDTR